MANLADDLEKDTNGQIILRPVTGWITGTAAGTGVILAIQYIEGFEQFETGGKRVQLALLPQQCLDLAETLTKLANKILAPSPEKPN